MAGTAQLITNVTGLKQALLPHCPQSMQDHHHDPHLPTATPHCLHLPILTCPLQRLPWHVCDLYPTVYRLAFTSPAHPVS